MTISVTPQEKPVTTPAVSSVVVPRQGDTKESLTATPEVTAAPEAPKVPDEQGLRFQALARKEKEIRRQQEAVKAEKAALEAKLAEYEKNYIPKARLSEDVFGALQEAGLTYDDVVQRALNLNPTDENFKKVQAEQKALRDELAKTRQEIQEQQKKSYESAVNQIRSEAKVLVDSDPAFETIKAMDAYEAVVELIKEEFEADNSKVMSVSEAAKLVEEHLLEQAMKMASIEKVKTKLIPPAPAIEEKQETQKKPQQLKTITNAVTTATKPPSDRERRQRAVMAYKGELK